MEGVKKFCHNCWKWKLLKHYRIVLQAYSKRTAHCDWCRECEKEYGIYKPPNYNMDKKIKKENENDNEWEYTFIGNKPYKRICEINNIIP